MVSSANYGGWKLRGARSGKLRDHPKANSSFQGRTSDNLRSDHGTPPLACGHRLHALLHAPARLDPCGVACDDGGKCAVCFPLVPAAWPHAAAHCVCVCSCEPPGAHTRACAAAQWPTARCSSRTSRASGAASGRTTAAAAPPVTHTRASGRAEHLGSPSPRQRQEGPRGQLLRASVSLLEMVHARPHGTHLPHVHMHSRSMLMACACGIKQTHGHAHLHLRCTSAGKASSAALVEIADLVEEYLPKRPITLTL